MSGTSDDENAEGASSGDGELAGERAAKEGSSKKEPAAMENAGRTNQGADDGVASTDKEGVPVKPDPEEGSSPTADDNDLEQEDQDKKKKDVETETDATADSMEEKPVKQSGSTPIVSSSKKSRPPYKYNPNKITLRFLFANKDGLTVTLECNPSDTVGEVKGALISVWPKDMPSCEGGEDIRLICMGKGYLMPDTRTLEDCQIPVFKTHPTPINVSIKPKADSPSEIKTKKSQESGGPTNARNPTSPASNTAQASRGCPCTIL